MKSQVGRVVLFIMLHKVVLTFESVDEILKYDDSNEATEQYFPVVLFIMLYTVVLTFESVGDSIRKCEHSIRRVATSSTLHKQLPQFVY